MFDFLNNPYNNNYASGNNYSANDNYSNSRIEKSAVGDFDTLQKARQDLIGEIQAVIEYDAHLRSTNDRLAKATWENIKNEELVHVGELLGLLAYLDPAQKPFVQKGLSEFAERLK
jgi:hypothetical protein